MGGSTGVSMQFVVSALTEHFTLIAIGLFALFSFWQIHRRAHHTRKAKMILKKAQDTRTHEPLSLHPEVDTAICVGCGTCTTVCPEGSVLKLIDHRPVLVSPAKCVGHGECERNCPNGAIRLVFGTKTRGMDIPRISQDYETNIAGLYIAGELGGMGLIRNAVKQGAAAAKHALAHTKEVPRGSKCDADLLVVGAGPAGLAACLVAIEAGRSYICIDQGSFGGTVYNYPRQKIVMSYPADLPGVGTMKFDNHFVSKEELLAYWNEVRRNKGIQIRENVSFKSLKHEGDMFVVETPAGEIRALKVVLALGVRGSPRKLGLANEDSKKVTYSLVDAEQYQDQEIAVVGAGNSAVEAAISLANAKLKNGVTLLVRGPALDRCNETNQTKIEALVAKGTVKILFDTSVKEIHPDRLIVETKGQGRKQLRNNFLIVLAGTEAPHKFLMSLGVAIDKKFGEALRAVKGSA